ncbi:MAG TPA: 23S rRNA (guanosine(2251)-2'-O)-methyltransferase RlmB [Pyrinomonadaceae bacterium]|nr:23S rRNA (guanosine(2251)-2'-O)-methyltransferase RlmB [Pyrinomonadaceae bacterium]
MKRGRNFRQGSEARTPIDERAAKPAAREQTPHERRRLNSRPSDRNEAHRGVEKNRKQNRNGEDAEPTFSHPAFSHPAGFSEVRPAAEQLYGVSPVLEALRAGKRPIERITIVEGAHESRLREMIHLAHAANVPVRRVPRAELQRLATAGVNHQGVIAIVAAAHYHSADDLLDKLAARIGTSDAPLAVVLDGVEDPRNLGAIIRTIECAGAHAVFIPERRAIGLTETVAKASAGALEYVPVARVANIARLIEGLKERGIWVVGAAAEASENYTSWDWTVPCALVLGGEGEGLRRLVREHCDALVRVPLNGRIESLNVSVAAGVVLYEAVRQRTAKSAAT